MKFISFEAAGQEEYVNMDALSGLVEWISATEIKMWGMNPAKHVLLTGTGFTKAQGEKIGEAMAIAAGKPWTDRS